jgi:hypothetical protein
MTEHPEHASENDSSASVALAGMAPVVRWALIALGMLRMWGEFCAAGSRVDLTWTLLAIARLAGFVLAGWVAGRLLRVAASALDHFAAQTRNGARLVLVADRFIADLERRAQASETIVSTPSDPAVSAPPVGVAPPKTPARGEIRVAIGQGDWANAEALIRDYSGAHPDDDAVALLSDELDVARRSAVAEHHARIDAARSANDTERIFEIRESIRPLLTPEALRDLDLDLARWFLSHVHKRLRNGVLTTDVVTLATRVADTFDGTREGASLRAALPTLRRSVGLCARCGMPYAGIADACPSCLAPSPISSFIPPGTQPPSDGGPLPGPGPISREENAPDPE